MGWFSWFKKSDKVVDTALDLVEKGASGIDMLFFTDEEKSIASAKVMDQVIEFNKATADENSIRSRTRRLLACLIIGNYLLILDVAIGYVIAGKTDIAKLLFKIANETLGAHVLAVVIFYFGYYGVKAVVKSAKE
jgi:hypothetical protein